MTDTIAVDRRTLRRERTRRQLTSAARELIATKGVSGLRIRDITDTADVGRGSFYNHFDTKEDLIDAIVGETVEDLAASTLGRLEGAADPAVGAADADRKFIRLAYDDPTTAGLIVNLAHSEAVFEQTVSPYARRALDLGVAMGRFEIADTDTALLILISSALAMIRAVLDGRAPEDADILHAESMLMLFGVAPREARLIARSPLEAA